MSKAPHLFCRSFYFSGKRITLLPRCSQILFDSRADFLAQFDAATACRSWLIFGGRDILATHCQRDALGEFARLFCPDRRHAHIEDDIYFHLDALK
jgi:hypothetical protein